MTVLVLPRWGWRAVFFVGILPAFLTLWVRAQRARSRRMWRDARRGRRPSAGRFGDIFRGGHAPASRSR